MTPSSDDHLSALMRVFEFTADDIAANKAGTMTSPQKHLMQRRAQFKYWSFGGFALALLLIAIVMVSIVLTDDALTTYSRVLMWLVIVLAVGGAVALPVLTWLQVRRDWENPIIEACCGAATLTMNFSRYGSPSPYNLFMQEKRFGINQHQHATLQHGMHYCVYHSKHTRVILSLEPMDSTNNAA